MLARGSRHGNLYVLEETNQEALNAIKIKFADIDLWHKRLGHPSHNILRILKSQKEISIFNWTKTPSICVSCQLGKSCKLPFKLSNKKSQFPLEKIHCDLWGPVPINSTQNFRFYALFIDNCTRFSWLFPLKHKSNFFLLFHKVLTTSRELIGKEN